MGLRSARVATALAALLLAFNCTAGSGTGAFSVNITLANPNAPSPGTPPTPSTVCVSQTLSDLTGALVQVLCSTGQFVSIGPRPGSPFIAHGGAYSYYLSVGTGSRIAGLGPLPVGGGTVTQYRVFSVDESNGTVDLLVGF
jgi:hypothetical protein